ncbi:Protein translocase subunit SecF [bioreactor metagenome]|uniref:Protein translocase subunit SecF n=1 Tax=bioreactor metagenome TaxID=1076179 RepID=A0A645D6P2_9ZZZZ
MVAAFSLFRIEINIEFVSAVLAIIGYSINDTIVTFDRLRENISESNIPQLSNEDRVDLVNKSLQQTVGRSILTTISTLLTVISLLIFGSSASFNFNLAMLFGLTAGTYSSIFIAPVLWLWFEKIKDKLMISRKEKRKNKTVVKSNEPEEYTFYGIND